MKLPGKANVLFLCYYFPPMGMGGTQRAAKFAKYLPVYNWQPIIVTVKDVFYYAHDDSLLNELESVQIYRTESFDPLRILARIKKNKKQNDQTTVRSARNFFNLLNDIIGKWFFIPDSKILWIPFAIITSIRLIKKKKIKVLFTTSPPHSVHVAGILLKWMTSVKWVADFRDDWTGGESQPCPSKFHLAINRFLEKLVLKNADHVTGMCDHLTSVLKKKGHRSRNNYSTITNGYDKDDFLPVIDTPASEKFTITHCGSISKVSNPEPFLCAFKMFLEENPEFRNAIKIQFIGTDIFGILKQAVDRLQLTHVIDPIRYLPHKLALKRIMESHVLLLTILKKSDEEIVTGKVFEYLGSGKAILMISGKGYVASLIQNLNRGIVIDRNDTVKIKDTIIHYLKLFQNNKLLSHKALSITQFDRKYLTGRLAEIFRELETHNEGGIVED